eukprot:3321315-Rhodomonas_salina.1
MEARSMSGTRSRLARLGGERPGGTPKGNASAGDAGIRVIFLLHALQGQTKTTSTFPIVCREHLPPRPSPLASHRRAFLRHSQPHFASPKKTDFQGTRGRANVR